MSVDDVDGWTNRVPDRLDPPRRLRTAVVMTGSREWEDRHQAPIADSISRRDNAERVSVDRGLSGVVPPRTGGAGGSPNRGEWGDESEVGAVIVRAYAAPSIRSQWARGAAAREAAGPILEEWARRSLMFHVKH